MNVFANVEKDKNGKRFFRQYSFEFNQDKGKPPDFDKFDSIIDETKIPSHYILNESFIEKMNK